MLKARDMQIGEIYQNWCGEWRMLLAILDYENPYVMSKYVKGGVNGKENGEFQADRCFPISELNSLNYKLVTIV